MDDWARVIDIAEHLHSTYRDQGFQTVEITDGAIVMTMSPSNRHEYIHKVISRHLEKQFDAAGSGLVAESGAHVELPGTALRQPDLVVLPLAALDSPGTSEAPDVVEAVVEVVSPGNPDNDYCGKTRDYARMAIADYLILDPRHGTGLLLSDPEPSRSEYSTRHTFRFGDTVKLGAWTVDTTGLPLYGGKAAAGDGQRATPGPQPKHAQPDGGSSL